MQCFNFLYRDVQIGIVLKERKVYLDVLKSWLSRLTIVCNNEGIIVVSFKSTEQVSKELLSKGFTIIKSTDNELLLEAKKQLTEYLSGWRRGFNLPLNIKGTDFQLNVWKEAMKIPYGETISYSELASRIGSPRASRAAGAALASNPTVIIVPCHRVIRKSGDLGGFSGKLGIKRKLLVLERHGRHSVIN